MMPRWRRFCAGAWALLRRGRWERDLAAEVESWDALAAEARRRGASSEAVREHVRASGWECWAGNLGRDASYALRGFRRNPGWAALVVLTLGLGIGASTALFSWVYAAMWQPLPYPQANRLMWVSTSLRGTAGSRGVSGIELAEWRPRLNQVFSATATVTAPSGTLWAWQDQTISLTAASAAPEVFPLLGVRPVLGRLLAPGGTGSGAEVVLSYDAWQREFGGNPAVIGTEMSERNGAYPSYAIVGVLPPAFTLDRRADAWLPLEPEGSYEAGLRGYRPFRVLGLLKPGASRDWAQDAMRQMAAQEALAHPKTNLGWTIQVQTLADHERQGSHQGLLLLWAACACLLLVACVNAANLLLARAGERQTEIAMRQALGASRRRIAAQMLIETALLGVAGAVCGVAAAAAGVQFLTRWGAGLLPDALRSPLIALHADVLSPFALAFALLAAAVAVLGFGLWPAVSASRSRTRLAATAPSGSRRWLAVAELALATVLAVCAGLLAHSFARLAGVDPGFRTVQRLSFQVELPYGRPAASQEDAGSWIRRRTAWWRELEQRLAAAPGVRAAGGGGDFPLASAGGGWGGIRMNGAVLPETTTMNAVTPGYFAAMGIPLLAGRNFSAAVAPGPKQLILNQTMAALVFPRVNPVGRQLAAPRCGLPGPGARRSSVPAACIVIGVVGDLRYQLDAAPPPTFYYDMGQDPPAQATFVIWHQGDEKAVAAEVRSVVAGMPAVGGGRTFALNFQPLERTTAAAVAVPRFQGWLSSGFALFALLLAAVGVYGVESYSVSRRTREFGVRVALGAAPGKLAAGVAGAAVARGAVGVGAGLAAGVACGVLLRHLLFQTQVWDPLTMAIAPIVLLAVALAAAWLPARRAARVDAAVALRAE